MGESMYGPYFPSAILTVNRHDIETSEMEQVEGTFPSDLQGHLYLLAAAGFANSKPLAGTPLILPSIDGAPVINGDGMMYRFDFNKKVDRDNQQETPGKVWLTGKIAATPSQQADRAIFENSEYQQFEYFDLGVARLSEWLGVRNVVNTAWLVAKFPGENTRLLVTLDAGRPYEIDPISLDTITALGWQKNWVQQIVLKLPFGLIMSTAHPYFDPRAKDENGESKPCVITVNYGKSFKTLISPALKSAALGRTVAELVELLGNFLKLLKFVVGDLSHAIARVLRWEQKFPFLKALRKLERTFLSTLLLFKIDLVRLAPDGELTEFCRELKQVIIEDLHDSECLEDCQEHLQDLIQFINLALQFIENAENLQDITYVLRWDGSDNLERWKLMNPDGTPVTIQQTMHQIGVTEDYIVLMDTSLKIGLSQLVTLKDQKLDRLVRKLLDYPQLPDSTIYLVPRNELKDGEKLTKESSGTGNSKEIVVQKLQIPREGFHYHVDYANPNDTVTLHAIHACAWDVAEWLRKIDIPLTENPRPPLGMLIDGMDINQMGRYQIQGKTAKLLNSTLTYDLDYTWATGLYAYSPEKSDGQWYPPEQFEHIYLNSYGAWKDLLPEFIYDLYKDYKYREIPAVKVRATSNSGKPANLCRLNTQTMELQDGYTLPDGHFANSPHFIPRANGSGGSTDGYLFCTVDYTPDPNNSLKASLSEIWIFDAGNLQGGPVCKLRHPQMSFAFSTHSAWLDAIAPRNSTYCIPVKEDFQEIVDEIAPRYREIQARIQKLFDREIYPHFPKGE
ncbi:carotenoid oxygenase family protein [Lusitaniella coriacea]|uniref:carotenoid oxygenase family protein n=1 Tax=Lusitaniella coriacea TaxID=1983105 RepID=UPI003CF869DC